MNDEMKKSISEMLTKKYDKGSVEYLAKEGAYIINAPMKMVVVSKDKKNWKVVFCRCRIQKTAGKSSSEKDFR